MHLRIPSSTNIIAGALLFTLASSIDRTTLPIVLTSLSFLVLADAPCNTGPAGTPGSAGTLACALYILQPALSIFLTSWLYLCAGCTSPQHSHRITPLSSVTAQKIG